MNLYFAIPKRSPNYPRCCLTSMIVRQPVFSTLYDFEQNDEKNKNVRNSTQNINLYVTLTCSSLLQSGFPSKRQLGTMVSISSLRSITP